MQKTDQRKNLFTCNIMKINLKKKLTYFRNILSDFFINFLKCDAKIDFRITSTIAMIFLHNFKIQCKNNYFSCINLRLFML